MKIKFLYPLKQAVKKEDKEEIITTVQDINLKLNDKFIYQFTMNQIDWMLVNCLKAKTVVLIGKLRDKFYWCNSIPFPLIYKAIPFLKSNEKSFNKTGFHSKILEALFKHLKIKDKLDSIDKIAFSDYVKTEFKTKD